MSSGTADNEPGGHDGLRGVRRFFDAIGTFWQRVTEGIEVQVLWSQFTSEARASYSLYTREVDWDAFRHERRLRRFLKISRALFWAMLMKLSPARRVFLLIALALAVLALTATATIEAGKTTVAIPNNFLYVILAVGALVFLLALELADRVTMKSDLEIARDIQLAMLPSGTTTIGSAGACGLTRRANTVGGDFYDLSAIGDDGRLGIASVRVGEDVRLLGQRARPQAAALCLEPTEERVPQGAEEVAEVVLVSEQARLGQYARVCLLDEIFGVLARAAERQAAR